MAELNKVTVNILNESYGLRTDRDAEYLHALAAEVEERIRELRKQNPSLTASKAAILLCLETLDERSRSQQQYEKLLEELENLK